MVFKLFKIKLALLTWALMLTGLTAYAQYPVVESHADSSRFSYNVTSLTLVINRPAGTQDGDLLIASVRLTRNGAVTYGVSITAPAGWILVRTDTLEDRSRVSTYQKVASGEPASWTWTGGNTNSSSPSEFAIIGAVLRISGSHIVNPVNVQNGSADPAPSTLVPAAGDTTTSANTLLLYSGSLKRGIGSFTPPGGMTEVVDINTGGTGYAQTTFTMARQNIANTGATGDRIGEASFNGKERIGHLVAINPCQNATLTLTSAEDTDNQTICFNDAITNITYAVGGSATGAGVTGLPAGVNGNYIAGVFTISGTPTQTGTFNYTVTTTGTPSPCTNASVNGAIVINARPSASITPDPAELYIDESLPMNGNPTGGSGIYTHLWTGTGAAYLNFNNIVTPVFSGAPAGNYSLTYTVTDDNGYQASDSIIVTVNAVPNVTATPSSQTICSAGTTNIVLTSTTPTTTFAWTIAIAPAGSVTGASPGSGSTIAQTLTNITVNPATVTYTVTPTANGCPGIPINVVVTVNPIPTLSSSLTPQTICSEVPFFYHPTSGTPGTVFTWTRASVPNVTPPTGSGTGDISEILTNHANGPRTVHYLITLTANGCANSQVYDLALTVNPVPNFTSGLNPPAICSGSFFNYTPLSNVPGAIFTWSRAFVLGIAEPANSSTGSVSEILTNTTPLQVTVTYAYTVSFAGCTNPTIFNVQVVVKPTPVMTSNLFPPGICSGNIFSYTPITVSHPALRLPGAGMS